MPVTQMEGASLKSAQQCIPAGQPVVMLNLLRYRQAAEYAGKEPEPLSGRDVYHQRYVPAFGKIAALIGPVQVLFLGAVQAGLVAAPGESWDEIVLVEYPSFETFRAIVESPAYAEQAEPHRLAALADWRLIAVEKVPFP